MTAGGCRQVRFDTGPLAGGTLFANPVAVIEAWDPAEVPSAFAALQAAQGEGRWLAGWAGYELGYALTPKLAPLMPEGRDHPLLQFGVFDRPEPAPAIRAEGFDLTPFTPLWDEAAYARAFAAIHRGLTWGDIYQANLTFALEARLNGSAEGLYHALVQRQPVPHGALVDLGGPALMSRSPELFFALSAAGMLRTRPMKGTIGRGDTGAEDAALRQRLATSEKDQAENLMITDLLRNDLGRISRIGTVRVPTLFEVETYATVHQMVSEVVAEILPGQDLMDIFTALFPCGSVTGAPKIRAMELLREVEAGPRGPYCGSIGWIAPDGAMEFNVAIRTIVCAPSGRVTLNVGGGVVHDSTAEGEYREALLKATFAEVGR